MGFISPHFQSEAQHQAVSATERVAETAYQAVEKPLGQAKWGVGEQAATPIPQSVCASPFFGQAAVQPQAGKLNRVFQQPVMSLGTGA